MEDEITRSDLTLNSTPDHVLADFLSDLLLHLVNLLVFLVDLVLHLVHLPVLHLLHLLFHHRLIIIQHLPNRQQPTTNTIVTTGIRFDPEFYS